jgi:hypothetical protein
VRSSFASRSGLTLLKTPSHRQQAGRRRLVVICTVLAMALASGLIGSLAHSGGEVSGKPQTGPFSYFPSE